MLSLSPLMQAGALEHGFLGEGPALSALEQLLSEVSHIAGRGLLYRANECRSNTCESDLMPLLGL